MFHESLSLFSVGAAIVATMMLLLWIIHLRIRSAAIVDVGWAAGLGFSHYLLEPAGF